MLTPSSKNKKRIPFSSPILPLNLPINKTSPQNKKQVIYEFIHGSAVDPHPQKADKGGEDAVYASNNIIVVADGVGGWKDYGVDAGEYAKNLIQIIANLTTQDKEKQLYYIENPMKLACAAVNLNKIPGSATLSIATLHPKSGILRTYCIGDSIYGLFRPHLNQQPILGRQQQYCFNHPYQVGSNFKNKQSNQQMQFCDPSKGVYNQFSFPQIRDSHFLLASDGIWDNLFPKEIHAIIVQNGEMGVSQAMQTAMTDVNMGVGVLQQVQSQQQKHQQQFFQLQQPPPRQRKQRLMLRPSNVPLSHRQYSTQKTYQLQPQQQKEQIRSYSPKPYHTPSTIYHQPPPLQSLKQILDKTVHSLIRSTKMTYSYQNFESPFYLKGKQMGLDVGKMAKVDDLSLVLARIAEKEVIVKS